MRRAQSIALLLALTLPALGFRECGGNSNLPPEQKAQAKSIERKVREADNYINEGIRAGIKVKRVLRESEKISADEAVKVDLALIQMQKAADEFHAQILTLKPGDPITDETITQWIQPVLTASQSLKGLAFKSAEAKAAFDTATASIGAGVQVYLALKGTVKHG